MSQRTALVTGAGGFIGRYVVKRLSESYSIVKAGIHSHRHGRLFAALDNVQSVPVDILDRASLTAALQDVNEVYHFAALVDAQASKTRLNEVNIEGTRRVWECAAASGVRRALLCSSAAVYGLLSRSTLPISEQVPARAIESYGATKHLGEIAALEVAAASGLHTTIIRPVAVFGPGEHTPFGRRLRAAAVSKLLLAGGFENNRFNYVQVEDVARAAAFLMQQEIPGGSIVNIAAPHSRLYEDAFEDYRRMLTKAGRRYAHVRFLARVSSALHDRPSLLRLASRALGSGFTFAVWHPGFDLQYSSEKLLGLSFTFQWTDFEDVLVSCLEKEPTWTNTDVSGRTEDQRKSGNVTGSQR